MRSCSRCEAEGGRHGCCAACAPFCTFSDVVLQARVLNMQVVTCGLAGYQAGAVRETG